MEFNLKEGNYLIQGVSQGVSGLIFTFEAHKNQRCELLIYKAGTYEVEEKIIIPQKFCIGSLYSVEIIGLKNELEYNYCLDGKISTDPYAKRIIGREKWADFSRKEQNFMLKSYYASAQSVSGKYKRRLEAIPKDKMILYKLNVRSFSMDYTKGNKGTFAALKDKIPYLKSLGVNCIECMPVYEFEELILRQCEKKLDYKEWKVRWEEHTAANKGNKNKVSGVLSPEYEYDLDEKRVNVWGYTPSYYYALKESFAFQKTGKEEFEAFIEALHENDMECVLEMHFLDTFPKNQIVDILKYWVLAYGVDGFHLLGIDIPIAQIMEESVLKSTKIFHDSYYTGNEENTNRYFVYNEEFKYSARKMLNFQEASLCEFTQQMRKQGSDMGFINYISDNNGFTLRDVFSYEQKHNEDNLEDNLDGNDWNYSDNCGVEGETRRKNVEQKRDKMFRNAIALLYLAQGVPLLYAGDEFGNSQKGNNNAYCQDNPIGWVNWKKFVKRKDLFTFVQKMIQFRKDHDVISSSFPMKMTDYSGVGYPDLSYHGQEAWQSKDMIHRYTIGMLYCGDYSNHKSKRIDMIYIAYNFDPKKKSLALPDLDKKKKWYIVMDTSYIYQGFLEKEQVVKTNLIELEGQSISILIGK